MNQTVMSRAQQLHWDIEALVRQGLTGVTVRAKHHQLAELYCQRARELLPNGDFSAWPDAFAAITHYAESGGLLDAYKTIDWALEQCDGFHDGYMMRSPLFICMAEHDSDGPSLVAGRRTMSAAHSTVKGIAASSVSSSAASTIALKEPARRMVR